MFLDHVKIHVKAGDGGAGMMTFRREKYVPHGGPAGGDGGHGGNVILVVNPRLNTLTRFQKKIHFKAVSGGHGGSNNKTGATGEDYLVEVPPGTVVRDAETTLLIADLTMENQSVVVARGGRGGRGNARFKSSTNQAPRIAEKGELGEERWISLELKMIADVGIVGVPNAGKSTLLSVVSAAKPKIAPYPFTTLQPNLGVAYVGDYEMVLADIPGLIEGAHAGVGLGHSFLRHVQRTRLLIHLLDGAGENPLADFSQITAELALYDEKLGERPQIVVLNKMDLPRAQAAWSRVKEEITKLGYPVMAISGVTHDGVKDLLSLVATMHAELPPPVVTEDLPVFRPDTDEEAFKITRDGNQFVVEGIAIERSARMTYWEYDEAVQRFQRILDVLGITQALRDAGIKQGDVVVIADRELEWSD